MKKNTVMFRHGKDSKDLMELFIAYGIGFKVGPDGITVGYDPKSMTPAKTRAAVKAALARMRMQ